MDGLLFLTTALAATTAFFAALVTWWQHRLSVRHFRNDTYARRIPVFHAVKAFMWDLVRTATVKYERAAQFRIDTSEADFLFGRDVVDRIDAMYEKALELASLQEQMYPSSGEPGLSVGDERSHIAQQHHDLLRRIMDENWPALRKAFKRSLALDS